MAIGTPVGGTATTNTTATTTYSVAYPASPAVGDLLILRLVLQVTNAVTTPGGWTVRSSPQSSGNTTPRVWLFTRAATGSESGSLSVTTPSAIGSARIYKVSGVDLTTPLDVAVTTFSAGAVTDYVLPGQTTVTDGVRLWVSAGSNANSGSFTPATIAAGTFTESLDSATAVSSMDAHLLLGAAGATGDATFVRSAALRGAAAMMALRPASDVVPRNIKSNNRAALVRSYRW